MSHETVGIVEGWSARLDFSLKENDAVKDLSGLTMTAEALRWLRVEVVERMNRGMSEAEILADMSYPPELFDHPWMAPTYGCADYIVRDLYREENGWWDRNPTTLHPAPRWQVEAELPWSKCMHTGMCGNSSIAAKIMCFKKFDPAYLRAPAEACTITGLSDASAACIMARICSRLLTL